MNSKLFLPAPTYCLSSPASTHAVSSPNYQVPPVLTWNINSLEAPHVVWSQLINGADPWGRQHFLQEVCGAQAPHQGGELALSGRRADVGVHRADHGGVGRARATGAAVDVVKLGGSKTQAKLVREQGSKTGFACQGRYQMIAM